MPCSAAVAGIGVCNATVVQRVTAAAFGEPCLVADANSVSLSWEPGSGPDFVGYNLYRSPNSWGPLTRLNRNTLLAPVFTDDGAPSGQRVYYTVATVDRYKREGSYHPIATVNIPHAVALTWTPTISPGVVGYHIYRAASFNGPYKKLTLSPVVPTGFTDYQVPYGMYYYVATTVDASGNESGYSLTAQAVVPGL